MSGRLRKLILIGLAILLGVAIVYASIHQEETFTYRPMICYDDKLYGEDGIACKEIPTGFFFEGEIEKKVSSLEPMVHQNFVSNGVDKGVRIFASKTDKEKIYAELDKAVYMEYELIKE